MKYHQKFAQLLRLRGYSYEGFARALGQHGIEVSDGTVGNWATGKHKGPSVGELAAIARIFGVSADYLAFDELRAPNASTAFPLPPGVKAPRRKVQPRTDGAMRTIQPASPAAVAPAKQPKRKRSG